LSKAAKGGIAGLGGQLKKQVSLSFEREFL
jgi:hypothetical protein